ncbi:hypothetical protein FSP39_010231 [Pinctada imbricata]|uniref:Uncharacterized protein n=1 Tax=Pinctada imbricata TaxID=66713 RepID=A0AA88XLV0_PINIB|nr:hypothetical protein FSP39_010231 [Pinctada imbricata]
MNLKDIVNWVTNKSYCTKLIVFTTSLQFSFFFAVPLTSTSISVTIGAAIGHVDSELTYLNDGDEAVETVFSFPLDEQSAVYKFQAEIDGKIIVAECQEKEQARETYKDAIDQGHTAFLLEERDESADILTCKLGNLPPQSLAKLNICYVTELDSEPGGWFVYTLPTVLRPRYTPQSVNPANPPPAPSGFAFGFGASQKPSVYASTLPYTIKFRVDIHSRNKIREIKTNSDWMTIEYSDYNTVGKVEFNGRSQVDSDHDLTIHVAYEDANQPQAIVERGTSGGSGILSKDVLALSFYPDLDKDATTLGEFIFVIDRSGSMGGNNIKNAKETLLLLLKSLPVGCYFNVVSFGSMYSVLFDSQSEMYTESSLTRAIQLQQTMNADMGGTEILQPLQEIYLKSTIPEHPRQIFLLTDGGVANTKEVVKLVGQNANNSRVFAVGIGEGASTSLVKGVARAGRGKAVFVKGEDRLQEKVMSLLKCAMQPVVDDVSVEWELPTKVGVTNIPQTPPPIYNEEKTVLYALLTGSEELVTFDGRLKLKGKAQGREFEYCLDFTESQPQNNDVGPLPIHRLAAKSLIKELEDKELKAEGKESKEKITKQIVTVSLSANIASRHTSFVGVDKDSKVKVAEFFDTAFFQQQQQQQHLYGGGLFFNSAPMRASAAFAASSSMVPQGRSMGCFGSKSATPPYLQKQFISSAPQQQQTLSNSSNAFGSSQGFSFGGPMPPPPPPQSSSFGFGSTTGNFSSALMGAPAPGAPPPPQASSFGFGSTTGKFSFGAPPPPPPPQSSAFGFGSSKGNSVASFGNSKAPTSSSQFSFGASQGSPAPAGGFFAAKSKDQTPTFSFGGPSATSSNSFSGQSNFGKKSSGSDTWSGDCFEFGTRQSGQQSQSFFGGGPQNQTMPTSNPTPLGEAGDAMMKIVSLQTFVGSWSMSEELCKTIGKDLSTLTSSAGTQNMEVWATVLALAWLDRNCSQRKGEWEMIESKARRWLLQTVKADEVSRLIEYAKGLV